MSASWTLKADLPDGRLLLLHWSATRTPHPQGDFHGQLKPTEGSHSSRRFYSHEDADTWAQTQGVTQWRCQRHTRALPLAAILPISFSEAPPPPTLTALRDRFAAGERLERLAQESATPLILLRAALLGLSPAHPALQGLRKL